MTLRSSPKSTPTGRRLVLLDLPPGLRQILGDARGAGLAGLLGAESRSAVVLVALRRGRKRLTPKLETGQ